MLSKAGADGGKFEVFRSSLDTSLEQVTLLRRQLFAARLPATAFLPQPSVSASVAPVQFPAARHSPPPPAWLTDHAWLVEALGSDRDVAPVLWLHDHTD